MADKPMTFRESMAINMIKDEIHNSTDEFLKRAYKMLRHELKRRGIIKPRPPKPVEEDK